MIICCSQKVFQKAINDCQIVFFFTVEIWQNNRFRILVSFIVVLENGLNIFFSRWKTSTTNFDK